MGKSIASEVAAKLISHSANVHLPVGIVVNAGRQDRALYRGTLGELAAGEVEFAEGPAIIFVGEAIAAGDWHDAVELAERQFKVA
jgi:uroporphyrin-III C-methyltransferase/precorrin-2 dehydrogenase/sirohydrochlorin ferrochelatase